jgi:PAS domain S-box-containing protein
LRLTAKDAMSQVSSAYIPPKLSLGAQLKGATLRFYVPLLCTIFLSDLLAEVVSPTNSSLYQAFPQLFDAFITTLCSAPLLWFLMVRPLKREARGERARTEAVRAQVADALIVVDPRGNIKSFNPAAESIFGYGEAEMVGSSLALLLDQGQPGLDALLLDAAAPARTSSLLGEIDCRRRDGLALVLELSRIEFVLKGGTPEFLLIMRDITSRKRMEEALRDSEARFREIFHQSEEAIFFFKPGSCLVVDVNATAERVFGFSKAELQTEGLECLAMPADLPALTRSIRSAGGENNLKLEFVCRRKDQEEIVVSMRGKIILLQGVPITYCTFRDVTERIRMEEMTRDMQARLIQANKMTSLGLLVSGVAHEINNPNNFIMANAELLSRISEDSLKVLNEYRQEHPDDGEFYLAGLPFSELPEHARRLFDGIAEGSRRVNDIVTNLKGFARQDRRQSMREVDVNEVVRSAVSLMRHELIKFTDNFHLQLADSLPTVKGHGQHLGQVIINLLMNACQALPDKQSGIWLSTGYDPEAGMLTVAVKDEGSGMSREDSRRILEPFFTTRLDDGGTGLGLSISESIVKEHGGSLEFTSEQGKGTTFRVKLPTVGALPPTDAKRSSCR